MISTNWPAPNVWVFIAQLAEHCGANAEAMGSNPFEVRKFLFALICNCLNCNNHCDDHISIEICVSAVHIISVHTMTYDTEISLG